MVSGLIGPFGGSTGEIRLALIPQLFGLILIVLENGIGWTRTSDHAEKLGDWHLWFYIIKNA